MHRTVGWMSSCRPQRQLSLVADIRLKMSDTTAVDDDLRDVFRSLYQDDDEIWDYSDDEADKVSSNYVNIREQSLNSTIRPQVLDYLVERSIQPS